MRKNSLLSPNLSTLLVPFVYITLSIFLFILALKIGLARITDQRAKIAEGRKTQNILSQKESLLRQVEVDILSFVDASANAIPEKNPALTMLAQIRNIALVNGLTVTSFKIASQAENPSVSSVDVSFGVDGGLTAVVSFLKSLSTLAPLSTVEKAKINQAGSVASANVTVRVYFATYPTKLPSLTEAVYDLTSEERELLDKLTSLTLPTFSRLTPQEPGVRENPFD
ncbi:MAG: type 4a pilus biogenesis protein PilO [Patescibacteria group bacterium]